MLYENKRFDYNKLSEVLILQAKFFQNILTQLRPEPEYFRVGFYGLAFPLFIRVSILLQIIYFVFPCFPYVNKIYYQLE